MRRCGMAAATGGWCVNGCLALSTVAPLETVAASGAGRGARRRHGACGDGAVQRRHGIWKAATSAKRLCYLGDDMRNWCFAAGESGQVRISTRRRALSGL
jgi:hypothetical protein